MWILCLFIIIIIVVVDESKWFYPTEYRKYSAQIYHITGILPVAAPGFKKWGGKKGQRLIMGGQTCARSAHSEREARADFFWANMCAERT